jgi:hypothetical protein
MARYAANAPSKLELPTPACVYALFVAGALTKSLLARADEVIK